MIPCSVKYDCRCLPWWCVCLPSHRLGKTKCVKFRRNTHPHTRAHTHTPEGDATPPPNTTSPSTKRSTMTKIPNNITHSASCDSNFWLSVEVDIVATLLKILWLWLGYSSWSVYCFTHLVTLFACGKVNDVAKIWRRMFSPVTLEYFPECIFSAFDHRGRHLGHGGLTSTIPVKLVSERVAFAESQTSTVKYSKF